jgi:argininosuccinate lyase
VRLAETQNKPLEALTLAEMQSVEKRISKDVFAVLGVQNSVKSRVSYGGTAPANVRRQVARWRKQLASKAKTRDKA